MSDNLPVKNDDAVLENLIDIFSDISEVELDSLLDADIIREIPVISTAVKICKTIKGIRERAYINKLDKFLSAFINGIRDSKKEEFYRKKITENKNRRNTELKYILVIIEHYIGNQRSEMLAKVYLSFLDEKITWDEFVVFSEIIDRLLPIDYALLRTEKIIKIWEDAGNASALRLVSLGLADHVIQTLTDEQVHFLSQKIHNPELPKPIGEEEHEEYKRTVLGDKLVSILGQLR